MGVVAAGAALTVVGCFMPAAEPQAFAISVRDNTLMQTGDGRYFLIVAAIAVIVAYRRWATPSRTWVPFVLLGLVVLAAASYERNHVQIETFAGNLVATKAGTGLYAAWLGGALMIAGASVLRSASKWMAAYDEPDEPYSLREDTNAEINAAWEGEEINPAELDPITRRALKRAGRIK